MKQKINKHCDGHRIGHNVIPVLWRTWSSIISLMAKTRITFDDRLHGTTFLKWVFQMRNQQKPIKKRYYKRYKTDNFLQK